MKAYFLPVYYSVFISVYVALLFIDKMIAKPFGVLFLSIPTLVLFAISIYNMVPSGSNSVNDSRPPSVSGL